MAYGTTQASRDWLGLREEFLLQRRLEVRRVGGKTVVGCVATPANSAVSQPTTITAIEVGSVTRIT